MTDSDGVSSQTRVDSPIFLDPRGRRHRWVRVTTGVATGGGLLALVTSALLLSDRPTEHTGPIALPVDGGPSGLWDGSLTPPGGLRDPDGPPAGIAPDAAAGAAPDGDRATPRPDDVSADHPGTLWRPADPPAATSPEMVAEPPPEEEEGDHAGGSGAAGGMSSAPEASTPGGSSAEREQDGEDAGVDGEPDGSAGPGESEADHADSPEGGGTGGDHDEPDAGAGQHAGPANRPSVFTLPFDRWRALLGGRTTGALLGG